MKNKRYIISLIPRAALIAVCIIGAIEIAEVFNSSAGNQAKDSE